MQPVNVLATCPELAEAASVPAWLTDGIAAMRPNGAGIITGAGGNVSASRLLASLQAVDCRLPVQVWRLPEESPIAGNVMHGVANVRCSKPRWRGWSLKAVALALCPFEQAIWLDADVVALDDPAAILATPEYAATGAVFWQSPDAAPRRARMVGVPVGSPGWETGIFAVDKRRHWQAVMAAYWMCEHAAEVFRATAGDADAFQAAWRATGAAFHLNARPEVVKDGLLHPKLGAAFHHRCWAKGGA